MILCINLRERLRKTLLIVTFVVSVHQSLAFYSSLMCNNDRGSDCSFQISSNSNSCLIYNTEVCNESLAHLFLYLPLLYEFETEKNVPLEISSLPYVLHVNSKHLSNPVSALNITIKVKQSGVHAFSLMLSHVGAIQNICRIFDFRNVSARLQYPITFFYDCFNKLAEKSIEMPVLSLTAYPLNVRLKYMVFIPPAFEEQQDSVCSWKPLVMVLLGGLKNGSVHLRFAQAPEMLNVLHYILTLRDPSGAVLKGVQVLASDGGEMLSRSFSGISSGFYSLGISLVTKDVASCPSSSTGLFYVGKDKASNFDVMLLMCVLCIISSVLTFTSCVFSYMLYFHKKYCSTEKKILLIHCIDSPAHHDLVVSIQHSLERTFKCVVQDIYKTGCDAYSFILERFSEANVLVFVASEGACETIERDRSTSFQDNHPCQNQLQKAYNIYFSKFHRLGNPQRKACVISFFPSGQQCIPRLLKPVKFFNLPQSEKNFIFFLFGCLWCQIRWKSLRHNWTFSECLERLKKQSSRNTYTAPEENDLPDDDFLETFEPLNPEEARLTKTSDSATFEDPVASDLNFDLKDLYMEHVLFNCSLSGVLADNSSC